MNSLGPILMTILIIMVALFIYHKTFGFGA